MDIMLEVEPFKRIKRQLEISGWAAKCEIRKIQPSKSLAQMTAELTEKKRIHLQPTKIRADKDDG